MEVNSRFLEGDKLSDILETEPEIKTVSYIIQWLLNPVPKLFFALQERKVLIPKLSA